MTLERDDNDWQQLSLLRRLVFSSHLYASYERVRGKHDWLRFRQAVKAGKITCDNCQALALPEQARDWLRVGPVPGQFCSENCWDASKEPDNAA